MNKSENNFNLPELGDLYKLSHWTENEINTERLFAEDRARIDSMQMSISELFNAKFTVDAEVADIESKIAVNNANVESVRVLAQGASNKAYQVERELYDLGDRLVPIITAANETAEQNKVLNERITQAFLEININKERIEDVRDEALLKIKEFTDSYTKYSFKIVKELPDIRSADKNIIYYRENEEADNYEYYVLDNRKVFDPHFIMVGGSSYSSLNNLPAINGVTLKSGNNTLEDLNILNVKELDITDIFNSIFQ